MPVILSDEAYDLWLDPEFQKPKTICGLLAKRANAGALHLKL
jgi:putative SOS response-associated peptidase YedK